MAQVFFILQSAFSLWMLIDALQRRAQSYWYLVVLLPFGEWVYFFKIKIHDPEFAPLRRRLRKLTEKRIDLAEVRLRHEQTPSFENKLDLARELYNVELYGEAAEHFTEAHRLHAESRDALYGLALTRLRLEERAVAITALERLIELDPAFEDYAPWADLAQALDAAGRQDEALEVLDRLVIKSPRLKHSLLYALFLRRAGETGRARDQLETALLEHGHAPKFVQRRDRPWKRRAVQLLRELEASHPNPA